MTLTVEINGAEHSVALPPADPQKPIYVAVGEPGRRSEVWRIWANKAQAGKSDVYVAARPIAGRQKCSLHETGDWRHQWIRIEDAEAFTGTRCRILDQWQRGAETADGITPALSIWVLAEDVTAVPDDNLPRNVTWLPAPDPGLALGVHITLARPDQGFFPSAAPPIGGFTLANGEVVLVFADIVPVPDEGSRWLDEMRRVTMPGGRVVTLDITRLTVPGWSTLFNVYFHRVVPLVGALVAGDRAAYTYLPRSVDRFVTPPELAALMEKIGLRDVRCRRFGLGTVALHVGVV